MRLAKILSALLMAASIAACAGTSQDAKPLGALLPPAPAPEYKVGDEFFFKVGGTIEDLHKVISVEADAIVIDSRVFGTIRQPKKFANPAAWSGGSFTTQMSVTTKQKLDSLFPLEVGNVVKTSGTMVSNGITTEIDLICRVPRQENIAVLAGRFDTFVVDCEFTHSRGQFNYTYWYAPSVGHWVAISRGGRYQELASWKRAG